MPKAPRRSDRARLTRAVRLAAISLIGWDVALQHAPARLVVAIGLLCLCGAAVSLVDLGSSRARAVCFAGIETSLCATLVLVTGGWNSPFVLAVGAALLCAGLDAGARAVVLSAVSAVLAAALSVEILHQSVSIPVLLERLLATALAGTVGAYARHLAERQRLDTALAERRRIARELHDSLGQSLTAVGLELERIAGRSTERGSQAWIERALHELAGELRLANRGALRSLRDPGESPPDLVQALGTLLTDVQRRSGVGVELRHAGALQIRGPVAEEVWKITREAILNAERHSQASNIVVSLQQAPEATVVQVSDDGAGTAASAPDHFGLVVMQERAESIGARFAIASAPGVGTTVLLELPRVCR